MELSISLPDAEAAALSLRATAEERPVGDVVRQAIAEYVAARGSAELIAAVLDAELPRFAAALERLGR